MIFQLRVLDPLAFHNPVHKNAEEQQAEKSAWHKPTAVLMGSWPDKRTKYLIRGYEIGHNQERFADDRPGMGHRNPQSPRSMSVIAILRQLRSMCLIRAAIFRS
jgi:hypothetical protein